MANRNYNIDSTQLTENALICVRGNIEYARLLNKIEGDQLDIENQRRASHGMTPIDKPFTSVTIRNAKIVPLNPPNLTTEEQFVQERFYQSKGDTTLKYGIINKSPFPNKFYQANDPSNPTKAKGFIPEAELANGLDVILVLRVFRAGNFANKGIALNSIIVEEPVRYYQADRNQSLKAAGIELEDIPEQSQVYSKQTSDVQAPTGGPLDNDTPYSNNTNPYSNPEPQSDFGMNQPTGGTTWVCPECGNEVSNNQKFCGNCGTKKPENPYASIGDDENGGIRFDADDTNRDY